VSEVIQVGSQHYILATSSRADDRTWVLKSGDCFAVLDRYGDIQPIGLGEQGLYHEGTRFLSRLEVELEGERPLLLSSQVREGNELLAVDLTNADIVQEDRVTVPRHSLHVFRSKFLQDGSCFERFRVRNHTMQPQHAVVHVRFDADFSDIFEVRGLRRERRGERGPPLVEEARVTLPYVGLDDLERRTVLQFSPRPTQITASTAAWTVDLDPQQSLTLDLTTHCQVGAHAVPTRRYADELPKATRRLQKARARACIIESSNEQFNAWITQSTADVYLMLTQKDQGPYPYAGIPWFCTAFGRDGLISALETLWVDPAIAKGVLTYLAHMQASVVDTDQDAEPGKILHETRTGEMAATGEIPFSLYYGSVDATPLFLMLLGAYHDRTDDTALVEQLWPAAEHALAWMEQYGDRDGDGFLEYESATSKGLRHQGWKDSDDAVFHGDGRPAEGPIALCEVQGYAYAARCAMAKVAARLGHTALAEQQTARAASLRDQFDQQFWCDDIGTYALALDGDKRPCKVRSSNAGQCLFTGIVAPHRARQVADQLLGEAFFTGWGVRTVATSEARYNPMSYHNGSVWPHDTALIALGFSRYGLRDAAVRLLTGLFDASSFVDLGRLPELFCGFPRRPGEGPTRYPVACAPQTWASASVFLLLQACLGLTVEAQECRVRCSWPILPAAIDEVRIRNLAVAKGQVDLTFRRYDHDVSMSIARREGEVETVVTK
jgi:glycogen debranching enzyme